MKKILTILTLLLFFANIKSFSQTINLSADSVTALLCKKWEVSYVITGNTKIEKPSDMGNISYEFSKDKTFVLTSDKDKIKGTWLYDPKLKSIKLAVGKEMNMSISSLKKTEFIVIASPANAAPDSEKLKLVCTAKAG
ncbi:lipocalin-like domain-containing protein [Pinibacter soli]|uniref:DUF4923 family protein n=1 Tax=Pinibacter soli TaxID=3044211 RepID=A0ABT6RHR3_9BACT|nr:DUF4923 family protein [Pinibacter soli]MDI3322119.1 DUF4923 family protein [Pinibacter soli]